MVSESGRGAADNRQWNRRDILQAAGAIAGAAAIGSTVQAAEPAAGGPASQKGRINQSVVHWCFEKYWDIEKTAQIAKQLGCKSVELVDPKHWGVLKQNGLTCAIASSHGFVKGFNNPQYWDECIEKVKASIDACAAAGFPNVICFTGMREQIPDDVGQKNCIAGLKKVIGYAEKNKVNLCLEMLNSRDATEMKGHPGYQGDHTDYCVDIIKGVGSPRMKLLFDIYHVQIMDGDVIRRIGQNKEYIGHVHTAGNPGRRELDDKQEIQYRPIMQALVETGYTGYVGQEFIPTRDPLIGLREAVSLCDV
jgi:hydroxypyruvate isomerase